MSKAKEQYASSYEVNVSKDCKIQFNRRSNGELHIKVFTFNNEPVVLKEETYLRFQEEYRDYKLLDLDRNEQR